MKSQIMKNLFMKMSVPRNTVLTMLALLALSGVARAQGGDVSMLRDRDAADSKAAQEYINRMQTDEKYRETIRNQQAAPTANDPWGAVRPTTPPAKSAAKPATGAVKSASGSSKPATGKPAIGPAASANSATQKGQ
jgi:hypothetical protein